MSEGMRTALGEATITIVSEYYWRTAFWTDEFDDSELGEDRYDYYEEG